MQGRETVAGLLLAAVLFAPPVSAQQEGREGASGPFVGTIEVELVNVEVRVTDRQGEAVTGLGVDAFQLLHDGRPVSISHFTEMRGGEPVAAPAGESVPAEVSPGHLVIYFDQLGLHPAHYKALIEDIESFLAAGSVPPERVLLLRQNRGLFIEAPFGSSSTQLRAALAQLVRTAAGGLERETETRQAHDAIRLAWQQSESTAGAAAAGLSNIPTGIGPPGGTTSPRAALGARGLGPDPCELFLSRVEPIARGWVRNRRERTALRLALLSETAGFLAGLEGVKTLIYVSDGLDAQPGSELASQVSSLCPVGSSEVVMQALSEEMTPDLLALSRQLNTNRVTVYSLQAGGTRPAAGDSASEQGSLGSGRRPQAESSLEVTRRSGQRQGLAVLARETGGRAVFSRSMMEDDLASIGRELGSYYSLAYSPPESDPEVEHHIEVRLRDDSWTPRHRRTYRTPTPEQWLAERVEGALHLGLVDNPLEVRLGAGEMRPGEKGVYTLPLHVMVPVERLAFLPAEGGAVAQVEMRAVARNLAGRQVATELRSFRVRQTPGGGGGWADLAVVLELGAGTHAVAVGLRDAASRAASFVATTVEVDPSGL